MQQSTLQQIYQQVIQDDLGLMTRIDSDGDVTFRIPDVGHFYIRLDADRDPEYLNLIYPNFMDHENTQLTSSEVLDLINKTNCTCKGVLIYQSKTDSGYQVSAAIRSFVAGPDQPPEAALLKNVLPRSLSAIRHAVTKMRQHVQDRRQEQAAHPR